MKKISTFAVTAMIAVSAVSGAYAIAGVGFHWGFDLSMSMEDVPKESVNLLPDESLTEALGDVDFFYLSRTDWRRSAINFGGKAYIDFIPFIDAVELSCNFGLWQYDGVLNYLDIEGTADAMRLGGEEPVYKQLNLTLDNYDMGYFGLTGTPYAKLHFDATVRKTVLNLWLVKFNAGAGVSAHFATPLLSSKLIESALDVKIDDEFFANLAAPGGSSYGKKIVEEIVKQALGKPALGMHLLVGAQAKLPAVPVGIYIDGKFMIPFSKFDDDAGAGVKGYGFLINTGLSLSI